MKVHAGTESTAPMAPYVGIDFGTSKSAIAWYNPRTGQAEILKNAEEQDATPSAVYFGTNETLVGQEALNVLEDAEEAGEVQEARRVWINVKRELADGAPRFLDGQLVYPFRVAKEIFAKLKRDAEEYKFHHPVQRAVVTCPASFNVVQRDKIRHAALAAGFTEVELLDEPVAAAIAYTEDGQGVGKQVLVYDLGGGTFDVAMLTRDPHNGAFRLAASPQGIANYGGNAFDLALYDYCRQAVAEAQGAEAGEGTAASVSQPFLQRCRECKEALSSKEAAKLSTLVSSNGRLQRFQETITRATFEDSIRDKVEATVRLTAAMEEQTRQAGEPVDTVVLVGSSSRVPLVKELLDQSLPVPPRKWEKQGIAVALGAAYYAHHLWGQAEVRDKGGPAGPDAAAILKWLMELVKRLPLSSTSKYRRLLTEAQRRGAVIGPQVRDVREQLRVMIKELGLSPGQAETIEREVLGTTLTGEEPTNGQSAPGEPPEGTFDVVMPELPGQGSAGTILRWRKGEGDLVAGGETLAEVETDQVQAGVGTEVPGLLIEILVRGGTRVPFGRSIARIREWTDADNVFVKVGDVSLDSSLQAPFAVSPDGLLAGFQKSMTGTRLCVYRLPRGEQVYGFLTDPGRCRFSADIRLLAKVGSNVVPVWDLSTGKKVADLGIRGRLLMVAPVDLTFISRDRLFAAYQDNRVLRWDVDTRTYRQIAAPGYAPLLAARPDGRILITAGKGIDLWDTDSGERVGTMSLPNVRPTALTVSEDGRLLAVAGDDGVVRLWDLDTCERAGENRAWFAAHGLSFNPDATFLACHHVRGVEGAASAVAWVLNLRNGQPCFVQGATAFIAFLTDGSILTVQHRTGQVGLWTRREQSP